jgi:hypothetical protein
MGMAKGEEAQQRVCFSLPQMTTVPSSWPTEARTPSVQTPGAPSTWALLQAIGKSGYVAPWHVQPHAPPFSL